MEKIDTFDLETFFYTYKRARACVKERNCMHVCVCVCARARVRACVFVCAEQKTVHPVQRRTWALKTTCTLWTTCALGGFTFKDYSDTCDFLDT